MAKYKLIIDGKPVDTTTDKAKSTLWSAMAPLAALSRSTLPAQMAQLAGLTSPSLWIPATQQLAEQLTAGISAAVRMPPDSPITQIWEEENRKYLALCADLRIDPHKSYPDYEEYSQERFERLAVAARKERKRQELGEQILQRISEGTATADETEWLLEQDNNKSPETKRGPVRDSEEEMAQLIIHFVSTGLKQAPYRGRYQVSKWKLDQALKWARKNTDYFRVFPGGNPAMMKTIEKVLRKR